jgi:hypothetical protein
LRGRRSDTSTYPYHLCIEGELVEGRGKVGSICRECLELIKEGLETREGCLEPLGLADESSQGTVLLHHLKEVKVCRCGSRSDKEGAVSSLVHLKHELELGKGRVGSRDLSDQLLASLLDVSSTRVGEANHLVPEIKDLTDGLIAREFLSRGRSKESDLLAKVDEAGIGLGDKDISIRNVGEVHQGILGLELRLDTKPAGSIKASFSSHEVIGDVIEGDLRKSEQWESEVASEAPDHHQIAISYLCIHAHHAQWSCVQGEA